MGNGINPTTLAGMTSCIPHTLTLQDLKEQVATGALRIQMNGSSFLHLLAKAHEAWKTLLISAKRLGSIAAIWRGAREHGHSTAAQRPACL